jgi:hypothetical protein
MKVPSAKALLGEILAVLVVASAVAAQNAKQVASKTFPSVVMLIMRDHNGQPLSLGSGFFIRDDVVATNFHVIEGASAGTARIVNQKTPLEIEGLVAGDRQTDIALLKLSGATGKPLALGNGEVEVGEQVYAVGNPEGLEGTFSEGIVSGRRRVGTDSLIQITAPISPGSSGGPVLDTQGNVVGVAAATLTNGQNLNFAVPVSYVKALMNTASWGIVQPLSIFKSATSGQSIVSTMGSDITAGLVGNKFLWENAYYPDFTFSLENRLSVPATNVYLLAVFYATDGSPLDVREIRYSEIVPAGLAKRVSGRVDESVRMMTTRKASDGGYELVPATRVEFRVLDFQIVTPAETTKGRKKKR